MMRRNERNMQFNVDAYTARLIGRENVSKLEGAVLEIVKNAYDADAKVFCLYYSEAEQCVYILDNGTGMKESVLRENWMTIGNSSKKTTFKTSGNRIQTGAKGIGRFALDRISEHCEMLTISESGGLEWIVNWNDFDEVSKLSDVRTKLYDTDETLLGYANICSWKNQRVAKVIRRLDLRGTGTVFRLYGLHDDWGEKTISELRNHLENLLPPDVVKDFDIYFFDDTTPVEKVKVESANIDSFDYRIKFCVDKEELKIEIARNEFDFGDEEESVLKESGIPDEERKYFHGVLKTLTLSFPEIGEKKNEIGKYSGILYFNKITASQTDTEKFFYKDMKGRKNLTREFGGIKLYRDHFRVRPYGEYGNSDFDWLELASRLRRSPAGLGHPTGNWRVSPEQIVGIVDISRENTNLDDAANRNGIQDGIGFEQLKRVLLAVITEFERDRQHIGRKLAAYWTSRDILRKEMERIREWADAHRQKEKEQEKGFADDVENLMLSLAEQQEEEMRELQDEARMLQTLATTGIVTNMFMHEIRTLTNNIGQELDAAFEAIKYDRDMESAFQNIRRAIGFKKHFSSWFSVTIDSIRKDKRKRKVCNISALMKEFLGNWMDILTRTGIQLTVSCDEDINFRCFAFDIENIVSNLISNSVASFDRENDGVLKKKEIHLRVEKREEGFVVYYEDTGWGLSEKYKKRPDLITEAFESDKRGSGNEEGDGTGMGMWILKRTVNEYNGNIDLSENKKMDIGFKIAISLGGRYV